MSLARNVRIAARQTNLETHESELIEARKQIVAAWRAAYPEAAETSSEFHPLIRDPDWIAGFKDSPAGVPDEFWLSDVYTVTVRRHKVDPVFGSKGGMIQLGISAVDGSAKHDWRDFQAIKNQLVGPECEAFELYPAESRLVDPSNYYALWCFPSVNMIRLGSLERKRLVIDADEAIAPQREFPRRKP